MSKPKIISELKKKNPNIKKQTLEKIVDLAQEKKLKILEDCCEAHGGERKGKKLGAYGDVSALSFFVAHNITTGEGGMIFSSKEEIDNTLRELREFYLAFFRSICFFWRWISFNFL